VLENYKVTLVEADFYARHAINSYLAWDRRTRVTQRLGRLEELHQHLRNTSEAELPDTILLDANLLPNPEAVQQHFGRIRQLCRADLLVMSQRPQAELGRAIRQHGGQGYVLREEVGLQISWMIVWAKKHPFIVTPGTAALFPEAVVLPEGRDYPELTDRVRQALMLCVVEGMSAELAADEMGLSPHTIRTYIKEGYSILEANSDLHYPPDLSPQEKAFMRFTALALEGGEKKKPAP
jgi:DNA-binding NarL/FixJ family response regulator